MICWMITCDDDDPAEVEVNIYEALKASRDLDYCEEWQTWLLKQKLESSELR